MHSRHMSFKQPELKTCLLFQQPLKMPRQLAFSSLSTTPAESKANLAAPAAAFLLLCAFALMTCASHSMKWQQLARWRNQGPAINIHQVQPGADGAGGEMCIWQKGILMGEKCQLPDFSGVIVYDSAGNLVAPGRPCLMNSPKRWR